MFGRRLARRTFTRHSASATPTKAAMTMKAITANLCTMVDGYSARIGKHLMNVLKRVYAAWHNRRLEQQFPEGHHALRFQGRRRGVVFPLCAGRTRAVRGQLSLAARAYDRSECAR